MRDVGRFPDFLRLSGRRPLLPTCLALLVSLPGLSPATAGGPDGEAARAMFARFAALHGEWVADSSAGWNETTRYEVIARGSVVMGTTDFRGAPDRKMVTMFHLDGDRLVLTHYCEARNQPFLVADEIDLEEGRVVFRFAGAGNLPDRDHGHMDSAVYRFLEDGRLLSRWTWYENGEERWLENIEAVRIR